MPLLTRGDESTNQVLKLVAENIAFYDRLSPPKLPSCKGTLLLIGMIFLYSEIATEPVCIWISYCCYRSKNVSLWLLKYSFVYVIIEVDVEAAMTQSSELLTVKEVAAILRVSQPTVLRMIDDGELPAIRVRTQWRIRRSNLDDYLQRGGSRAVDKR